MTPVRRVIAVCGVSALLLLGGAGVASAQEASAPAPPVTNCYPLLSSLVCTVPVNVGPFNIPVGPFDFAGLFAPKPPTTP